ncbi:MAG: carboxylesterase, partial [Actinobacteria bacterium]|nr:carboxylesterase [Actinomycetota bacterium]
MTDQPVRVTFENFVRIESARMFAGIAASAGGSNIWNHYRTP